MKQKRLTSSHGHADEGRRAKEPRFYLSMVGKPTLFAGGDEIQLNSRKLLALVAYLSTRETFSESREKLAGLLWGDSTEEKARGSLRQTLSKFRDTEAGDLIDSNRLDVWLVNSSFQSDHAEILGRLREGTVDDRLLLQPRIANSLLEGYEDLDSGFRNWIMVYRQNFEDRLMRLLESRLSRAESTGEKRATATAVLNMEPTHEPAARAAMEASVNEGDPAGAMKIYKTLWDVLENDYDSEPSQETQKLVARIKLGEDLRQASKPNTQLVPHAPTDVATHDAKERLGHALFISNFETDESSADRKSVVRIFRSELLAALTRFRDWRVLEYEQLAGPPTGLAHVIEASAYGEGSNLRFILTLRELPSGKFVWSERFSLGADAWFDTMRTMIRRIAVALEVNISSERLERVAGRPELSLELFDRWLRGQLSIFRWKPEDEAIAEQLYRSIIAEAPHFAPAYAGMAGILNVRHLIFPGQFRSEQTQREALSFASRAVELDPLDSRTQLHLAWSHAMNAEFQKASLTFQLAFELNSDDPWTLVSAAEGLALSGSLRESLELLRLAKETGLQFSELQWSYQSVVWFVAGQYENCVDAALKADSALNCCGCWAAAALGLLGKTQEAKATARHFINRINEKWVLEDKPTDQQVIRWMLMAFPIASENIRSNLTKGLELAGLPFGQNLSAPVSGLEPPER